MQGDVCVKCNKTYDEFYMEIGDPSEIMGECVIYRIKDDGFCWCFCLKSLYKWITNPDMHPTNPVTRRSLNFEIVKNIQDTYELYYGDDDKEEFIEYKNQIVETQQAFQTKLKTKISLETAASHVYDMIIDMKELEGEEVDKSQIKAVLNKLVEELKSEGRK